MDDQATSSTGAMGDIEFYSPHNWASGGTPCYESVMLIDELRRREQVVTDLILHELMKISPTFWPVSWAYQIAYIRVLADIVQQQFYSEDDLHDVVDLLGRLLCQAIDIPLDCTRRLSQINNEVHELFFFTNFRAVQVYCFHTAAEKETVLKLARADFKFHKFGEKIICMTIWHTISTPIPFSKNLGT